jgi:hypothetical protein
MNFIVVIPSYKRYKLIKTHTLRVLEDSDIPIKKIFIFVANKTEYAEYIKELTVNYHNNIIIGKKGLKNQRNFISSYFPENINILYLDDDLRSINKLTNYNKDNRTQNKLKKIHNLTKIIKDSFKHSIENKSYLWGVYPINNAYFMFPKITTDLRFITGPMYGIINRHNKKLRLTIDEKEDTERTLQHFVMDNIVVRFNNITIDTDYYKNKGGMQHLNTERKKDSLISANYLIKKYPTLTKLNLKKKNGIPEVKLINK